MKKEEIDFSLDVTPETRQDIFRPTETTLEETQRLAKLALVGMIESRRHGGEVRVQERYEFWLGLRDL